jgi:hypothetical protein
MQWFRANRAKFAWLAFFALTCQLVLSFGHVHVGKLSSSSTLLAALAPHSADASAGANPSAPPEQPKAVADEFCAICTNLKLASALIVPAAPVPVPPISFVYRLRWSTAAIEPPWFDQPVFDARGPPDA